MGRYTISMRPRVGAAARMSSLLRAIPSARSSASTSGALLTPTYQVYCPYCSLLLPDTSARIRHVENTPTCLAMMKQELSNVHIQQHEHSPLDERETMEEAGETQPRPDKRRKVTVEEVPDEDALFPTTEPSPPISTEQESLDPTSTTGRYHARSGRLRRHKGLYVEEFPDPSAGAPISNERMSQPDLSAYMRTCGPMADPKCFEAAELLMTSKLTNADIDRHLKSNIVSTRFNMRDGADS
jgi:hypothetical protein